MTLRERLLAPRARLWTGLAVLLVAAVAFLLLGLGRRRDRGAEAQSIRVQVRDAAGEPVSTAEVYVELPEGADAQGVGSWSARTATLTLPPSEAGHTLYVQAPGFRSERFPGIRAGRRLLLRRGLVARLRVEGDTLPSDDPLRLVFRIRPAPLLEADVSEEEKETIVELIDLVSPPGPGEPDLPRRAFGFAVADTVAARGVLLPVPGRYAVRWGLFDAEADAWYSLGAEAEVHIGVEDDPRAQIFDIPVHRNALDRTRLRLSESVDDFERR